MAQYYSIADIGKELQKYGLRVGENPAFSKVGTHAPGSYHYSGKAIDVTDWRPDVAPAFTGGKPIPWKQRTGELAYRAKKSGLFTEALGPGDPGHETHVHLALENPAQASKELLQWVATGRYKTPEGKLTDVMPAVGPAPAPPQLPAPEQQKAGDTYIFVKQQKAEQDPAQAFVQGYIQNLLNPTMPPIKPMFNPAQMLAQSMQAPPLMT